MEWFCKKTCFDTFVTMEEKEEEDKKNNKNKKKRQENVVLMSETMKNVIILNGVI
jgi:hypothetical protein